MKKILIVGCGQLGSRHLQSLALVREDLSIAIVDPSPASLLRAQEIYQGRHAVTPFLRIEDLPYKDFDVVIVATSSDVRMPVLRMMKTQLITYGLLILEKVLFPTLAEYEESLSVCDPGTTFVNCPKRMFPYYQKIKSDLQRPVTMRYSGANWGLACNSIHFIDLVNYFSGELPVTVDTSGLLPEIFPSKRPGFIELQGAVRVLFDKGSRLDLVCTDDANSEIIIGKTLVNEKDGYMETLGSREQIKTPFQSELTSAVVEKFFSTGECELTPLSLSVECHLPMMRAFVNFHNKQTGGNTARIMIT